MSRELNLYPLSTAGKNIERAFLEDEIDEQTLKESRMKEKQLFKFTINL